MFKTFSIRLVIALMGLSTMFSCNKGTVDLSQKPGLGLVAPPSNWHRNVAVFAMISNVNFGLVTTNEAALVRNAQKIKDALQNDIALRSFVGSNWEMVWGPVTANGLKTNNTSGVDSFITNNTMYLIKTFDSASAKVQYVVAIAGTNIVSEKGWFLEDFNVFVKKDWGKANSGKISEGTFIGLQALLNMKDAATNKTLIQYFEELPRDAAYDIAFTGHSLGGALSPVMALKFLEWTEQNNRNNVAVSTYPIAGATPGDKEFAQYAADKFGDNYFSVINNYDIVPNSWQKDMFAAIPNLYNNGNFNAGKGFLFPSQLEKTYNLVKLAIADKNYTRIAQNKEFSFNGTPNSYALGKGSFFAEAGYQHTTAYFNDAFALPQDVQTSIGNLIRN